MAVRSSLNQVVQIGVEDTPGAAQTTVNRRLNSVSIEPTPQVEVDTFRPAGKKFSTIANLVQEWTEASLSGRLSFTEIPYLLSSVMSAGTVTQPDAVDAPTLNKWVFGIDTHEDSNPKTFKVEHGSSTRAAAFDYALVDSLSLSYSRSSVELSGSMFGRAMVDGVPLTTSGVTELDNEIVTPMEVSVYFDNDAASLGTTLLTGVANADWGISDRYDRVYVINAAEPSYKDHVEIEPSLTASLVAEANTEGMAFLERLRNGDTGFLRIEAVGPAIGAAPGQEFRVTIDTAVKVSGTNGFEDNDGVFAVGYDFIGIHDSTWGRAVEVTVQTTTAAL